MKFIEIKTMTEMDSEGATKESETGNNVFSVALSHRTCIETDPVRVLIRDEPRSLQQHVSELLYIPKRACLSLV